MKTKSKKYHWMELLAVAALLMSADSAFAQTLGVDGEGSGHSGGGEGFVPQFRFKVDQLRSWTIRNQFEGINTFEIDKKELSDSVIKTTDNILNRKIQIVPTANELKLDGQEKTCINHPNLGYIECNTDRWSKETPESQFVLVIHEVFGYIGFEANKGIATSDYRISMQFYPYVGIQYVLNDRPMDASNLCFAEYQKVLRRIGDNTEDRSIIYSGGVLGSFFIGAALIGPFAYIPIGLGLGAIIFDNISEYKFTNSAKMTDLLYLSEIEASSGIQNGGESLRGTRLLNKVTRQATGINQKDQPEEFLKARKKVAQIILNASNKKYLCKDGKLVKFKNVDNFVRTILGNQ